MTDRSLRITIGTHFTADDGPWTVVEMASNGYGYPTVTLRHDGTGELLAMSVNALVVSDRFHLTAASTEVSGGMVAQLPPERQRQIREFAVHLLEVKTGFRSGTPELALPHEPRAEYERTNSLTSRLTAKAAELGGTDLAMGVQQLRRYYRRFADTESLAGLIHDDEFRAIHPFERVGPKAKQLLDRIFVEQISEPTHTLSWLTEHFIARFEKQHPGEPVPARRAIEGAVKEMRRITGGHLTAVSKRSVGGLPRTIKGHVIADFPGHVIEIDATPADNFVVVPSGDPVRPRILFAKDVYTKLIVAMLFTIGEPRALDACRLLRQIVRPRAIQADSESLSRWRYVGVPETLVLEYAGLAGVDMEMAAASPIMAPAKVRIDHGKIFVAESFFSMCRVYGISVEPARKGTGSDKPTVERSFGASATQLAQSIPGYVGSNSTHRGRRIDNDSLFTVEQLEAAFRTWAMEIYPHHTVNLVGDGPMATAAFRAAAHRTGRADDYKYTPAELMELGFAAAGFRLPVPDPGVYYAALPVAWRDVSRSSIEVNNGTYSIGTIDFARAKSPYRTGKWPIAYDPDDASAVYLQDPDTGRWITIPRLETSSKLFRDVQHRFDSDIVAAAGNRENERRAAQRRARELERLLAAGFTGAMGSNPVADHRRQSANTDRINRERLEAVGNDIPVQATALDDDANTADTPTAPPPIGFAPEEI